MRGNDITAHILMVNGGMGLCERVSWINIALLRFSSIQGNLTWQRGHQQLVPL